MKYLGFFFENDFIFSNQSVFKPGDSCITPFEDEFEVSCFSWYPKSIW